MIRPFTGAIPDQQVSPRAEEPDRYERGHIQYNWFGIFGVFCFGLLCGWARWWSGSTLLTILSHVVNNLWATIVTVATAEWLSQ